MGLFDPSGLTEAERLLAITGGSVGFAMAMMVYALFATIAAPRRRKRKGKRKKQRR